MVAIASRLIVVLMTPIPDEPVAAVKRSLSSVKRDAAGADQNDAAPFAKADRQQDDHGVKSRKRDFQIRDRVGDKNAGRERNGRRREAATPSVMARRFCSFIRVAPVAGQFTPKPRQHRLQRQGFEGRSGLKGENALIAEAVMPGHDGSTKPVLDSAHD